MDKAIVFIDAGYLSKVLDSLGRPRIDFAKFSDLICKKANSERLRTLYYDSPPYLSAKPSEDERERYAHKQKFFSKLNKLPKFEVRLGRLAHRGPGVYQQKGVDTLLAIDLTRFSWRQVIQKAILVAGDSDFIPAIKEARFAGIIVQIYYAESGTTGVHDEVFEVSDEQFEITKELLQQAIRD